MKLKMRHETHMTFSFLKTGNCNKLTSVHFKIVPQICLKKKALTDLRQSTIHRFTVSVPVLILPVFRQLLLINGIISSKSLFSNEQTQCLDSRRQRQSYFTSTSINFSILYFQIDIIFLLNC